ncbi:MAG: prepilin peptidase [Miltoncostaeaceae bacterium]
MEAPLAYWIGVAAVFGLAFGSFSTLAIHRWPAGESLVSPRSHCTSCSRTLHWFELIPVISWMLQRGRCRQCGEAISVRYPLVELASGAAAAVAIATFGPNWRGIAAAVLLLALVPVVASDLEHQLIPDIIVLPAAAAGLGAAVAADPGRWWVPVVAAAGAAGFLGLLWLVYPGGMGLGDVKLALLLGAVLGGAVVAALALAFLAGALLGLAMLVRFGSGARKMAVPFGPFLAAGAIAALWIGPEIVDWYGQRLA